MQTRTVLAISGSLREGSSNTTLLRAAQRLAAARPPIALTITLYDGLADLPPFNPDQDDAAHAAVLDFRRRLRDTDAVLISSPEYAHGVSGVLKNALDWVVGSGELSGKPVALLNAAPWATHAQAQLRETLVTMDARFVDEASATVRILPKTLDDAGIAVHPEIAPALESALTVLRRAIDNAGDSA